MKGQLANEPRPARAGHNGAFIVPVERRAIPMPSGTTSTQFSINVGEIPLPERRYVAELIGLDRKGDAVRLMFGQASLMSEKVRSLVIVSLSTDAVRNLLNSSEQFLPAFRGFIERNELARGTLHTFSEEPPQTVALVANLVAVTFAGREAELDFFHLAPNSLRKVAGGEVSVDPVVRIDLATSLLAPLIEQLVTWGPELPPETK
jgi:hypothetical protein